MVISVRLTSYKKDIRRSIFHTFNRFICIFLIVALGVAFFSGIRATQKDMYMSADIYFDAQNLADAYIVSTMGLTEADVEAVKALEGVDKVMPEYSIDVLEDAEGVQNVITVYSLPTELNKVRLISGRMPEAPDECLLDDKLTSYYSNYSLGDTIHVYAGKGADESQLKYYDYKIVGTSISPLFLDFRRGSSKLGSGSVNGFIMVSEECFDIDYYKTIYVTGKNLKSKTAYTDEYEDGVDELCRELESIADEQCEVRRKSVLSSVKQEINAARDEYEQKKKEVYDEINEKYLELEAAQNKINEARELIANSDTDFEAARSLLAEKWEEYNEQKAQFDKAAAQVEAARQQLIDYKAQIRQLKNSLDAMKDAQKTEEYQQLKAQYNYMNSCIPEFESQLADGLIETEEGRTLLEAAYEELSSRQKELDEGEAAYKTALTDIEKGEKECDEGFAKYEEAVKEADEEFAKAWQEIAEQEQNITDKVGTPKWYVLNRGYMQSVYEFGENGDRIGAIGKVFPVIFFLVAILVCLTTMTRMVEEERTQIGTLKALGYSKGKISRKYILYCMLATVTGSIAGAVLGQYSLPFCIIKAYYILYTCIPELYLGMDAFLSTEACLIACLCTLFATWAACRKSLKESSAELMRPVAPEPGKRVLLERIGFIWKHLSFTKKASIRNLFRYKKRFFMTIIGIGGCMALMLVGFGVHDSIFTVIDKQFGYVMKYDSAISISAEDDAQRKELVDFVAENEAVEAYMEVNQTATSAGNNGIEKDVYIVVPEEPGEFSDFIRFGHRKDESEFKLSSYSDGVVISEKLANMLNVKIGDSFYILNENDERVDVTISEITENYVYNYVYITPERYETVFGGKPEYNILMVNFTKAAEGKEEEFGREVLLLEGASGISFSHTSSKSLYDMMNNLDFVVYVLIISAALLAFVVLYNLTNININERRRELATLKVLGFFDGEVSNYVFRENMMLTILGTIVGIGMGIFLHKYVIITAEVDMTLFGRQIKPLSYLYSTCLTVLFSLIVNFVTHFKLKKIDMVESLKSIE